jgi:hypothetical protein
MRARLPLCSQQAQPQAGGQKSWHWGQQKARLTSHPTETAAADHISPPSNAYHTSHNTANMPSQVTDIKQFIEICRRKDASCAFSLLELCKRKNGRQD